MKDTAVWLRDAGPLQRSGIVVAAELCARCSSLTLGSGVPVAMVLSNKSAPVLLAVGSLLAVASVLLSGAAAALLHRAALLARHPTVTLAGAIVILMAASLLWSTDRAMTARGLIEGVPVLAAAFVCATAWPMVFRTGDERFLFVGLSVAAVLIGVEKLDDMALHRLVGSRAFHSDLKRSAVPLAVLLWPALAACRLSGRAILPAGLVALAVLGAMVAHSGASSFALMAGGIAYGVARCKPSLALGAATFGLVVIVIGSGWAGTSAKQGLAAPLVSSLSSVHAAQRIRIWRAFERRVFEYPLLGHGFNTSQTVSPDLFPEDMTPELKTPSLASIHPHSMFLQVWVELGAVGIGASLAALLFALHRIRSSEVATLPLRLGFFVTLVAIALVSMSAWQPWWLAVTASGLMWLSIAKPAAAAAHRRWEAPPAGSG